MLGQGNKSLMDEKAVVDIAKMLLFHKGDHTN